MEKIKVTQEHWDNLTKWWNELLAGTFIQGKSALKTQIENENEYPFCQYCCLGVACEINGIKSEAFGNRFQFNFGRNNLWSYPQQDWFVEKFGFKYDTVFEVIEGNETKSTKYTD